MTNLTRLRAAARRNRRPRSSAPTNLVCLSAHVNKAESLFDSGELYMTGDWHWGNTGNASLTDAMSAAGFTIISSIHPLMTGRPGRTDGPTG